MNYPYFSQNGQVLPVAEAVVPLASVEYAYGFGVYETVRVAHGRLYFLEQHVARLLNSARVINLPHNFSNEFVQTAAEELIAKTQAEACNLKLLLIGGPTLEMANLYMLCLNPLFPDRKLYARGAIAITYDYERPFPQAKTLNMLPSYLAYRQARAAEAYDAVLINRRNEITEGTRTNFLAIKDRTIVTPPIAEILPGVMRAAVLNVARQNGFEIAERAIPLGDLANYNGACLTNTPAKIMPLRAIGDHSWTTIPESLQELRQALEQFLDNLSKELGPA